MSWSGLKITLLVSFFLHLIPLTGATDIIGGGGGTRSCIYANHGFAVSSLDLGSAAIGSSSSSQTTIGYYNFCNLPWSTTATITTEGNFEASPSTVSLGYQDGVPITITFRPTAPGVHSGRAFITYSGPVPSDQITLIGVGFELQPNINPSPSNFSFGNVDLNSTSTQTLTIRNEGEATLTGSLSASGPFGASPASFSVPPGGSQTASVIFSPSSRGTYSGELTISSNDPDSPTLRLALDGTGVAPYLQVIGAAGLSAVPLGQSDSIPITITNRIDSYPSTLNLSGFNITGEGFSFSGPDRTSLSPGESTNLGITFRPTTSGVRTGQVSFQTNDPSHSTRTISLEGTGVAASISPSSMSLDWGNVHLGTPTPRTLVISNTGSYPLQISSVTFPSQITVTPTVTTIPVGQSQNFEVTYTPASDRLSGAINIASNDPGLPNLSISLTGTGVTPRIISSSSLDFGAVYYRASSNLRIELPISNEGTETLTISNVTSTLDAFTPVETTLSIPPGSVQNLRIQYHPTAFTDQSATLTIHSNDYNSPTRQVALSGRGISYLDLVISHLEVTQAIQDQNHSIPMVAGKATAVRAYPSMSLFGDSTQRETIRQVDATLQVFRDGSPVGGTIMSSNGPIDVVPSPDRRNTNHTINFRVDGSLTRCNGCEIEFRATINPNSGSRTSPHRENTTSNNTASRSLHFYPHYEPTIYYVPLLFTDFTLPSESRMSSGADFMKKIYPLSGLRYVRRPPLSFTGDILNYSQLADLMANLFIAAHLGNVPPPDRTYGWFPEAYRNGEFQGIAMTIPSRVAMGGRLELIEKAQEIFAHEMGHTYGLCHTDYPVSESCLWTSNDNHRVEDLVIPEVGFDVDNQTTVTNAYDFMYSNVTGLPAGINKPWIHPQRFQFLTSRLLTRERDPASAFGCLWGALCFELRDSELITGVIYQREDPQLNPVYSSSAPAYTPPQEPVETPYRLRIKNNEGRSLFEYPIVLASRQSAYEGGPEMETATQFSIIAPKFEESQIIQILRGDEVLLEKRQSDHAPQLTLISPQSGAVLSDVLEVQWSATDADGDPLEYSVLYSPNRGETFEPIGVGLTNTSLRYDTSKLSGSREAMVRVVATDGINTTSINSPLFEVTSKPPELTILSPDHGTTVLSGTGVSLSANAFDPEDGPLPSESVQWRSSLDNNLGEGNPLILPLSIGNHEITATATDSDGNETIRSVTLFVVDGAEAPRADAGPDQTANEGATVRLDASQSLDPNEGDILSYQWIQLEGPSAVLNDPTVSQPTFVAPQLEDDSNLKFLLRATDSTGRVSTDDVLITVTNIHYPSISLDRTEVAFGSVILNESLTRTFSVSNSGDEPLEISGYQTSRTAFAASPNTLTIPPGEDRTVTVTFSPTEPASYEATLTVLSNSISGVRRQLTLKGTAPEPVVIYNDQGAGGDLLPQPEVYQPPVEILPTAQPTGANPERAAGGLAPTDKDPDSFEFVGIGGCSLVDTRSNNMK